MNIVEAYDELSLISGELNDLSYLSQEIREDYFEKFDRNSKDDGLGIVWEYSRYAALYHIFERCMLSTTKRIDALVSELGQSVEASSNAASASI